MANTAIYPGTFDPLTLGHLNIIKRASGLFDHLIVAIAANSSKQPLFSLAERIHLAQTAVSALDNVAVYGFSSLMADFAKQHQARVLIRGVRSIADFEYEKQLAEMNQALLPGLETVFLLPDTQHSYVSSSLVKEVARHGGETAQFLTPDSYQALRKKLITK